MADMFHVIHNKEVTMLKVGLMGYGKAGQAVARVLADDPRYSLQWVMRRQTGEESSLPGHPDIPIAAMDKQDFEAWFNGHPVDAIVDFSSEDTVYSYGETVRTRQIMLVTAISGYSPLHLHYLRGIAKDARVLCSPNITLGINFLLLAARLLRGIAPFADVEIVEQHFREKPEVSGTARKLAESLELGGEKVTSLRVGGIVGHHEVIFGFPHQTVRLIHDAIRREAFGTGVAYALEVLGHQSKGFYEFDELLLAAIRAQLLE